MPTTFGSIAMEGYRPPKDATVARRLREAGAVVIAKTSLPDWATSWFSYSSKTGDTRNPYDLDRDPGGSSAGTGAAVAANLAAVGAGDRLRRLDPVAGVVLQPRRRAQHPRPGAAHGHVVPGHPAGHRRPDDAHGRRRRAPHGRPRRLRPRGIPTASPTTSRAVRARTRTSLDRGALRGARIGLVTNALGSEPAQAAEVNAVVEGAVAALRDAGATVVETEIPSLLDHILATSMYTDRSKHDLDLFLSERSDPPIRSLAEAYDSGQYDKRLDLMDAIMEGPDEPDEEPDYLKRFAARHEFTLAVLNVMGADRLDALTYPTRRSRRRRWPAAPSGRR